MMPKTKYKTTPYGEYQSVVKRIYSSQAIKEAHQIQISKIEAADLLKTLSKKYLGSDNILDFKWERQPKHYAGIKYKGRKKIPYIRLNPMKKNKKCFGLRAGIVLHEFAHALSDFKSKEPEKNEHGNKFIKTFNKVLRFYFKKYR